MTREAKMEAGAKPARSRHCKEGATFQTHCKIKPERLPKLAGRGMKRGYPSQETCTETSLRCAGVAQQGNLEQYERAAAKQSHAAYGTDLPFRIYTPFFLCASAHA